MKYFYLLFLICIFTRLEGQLPKIPYQPIQFENITPSWYFASGSEVFKSPYYDEYNKLYRYYFQKPVLENNYIYNLLLVDGRDQEGAYLEKFDSETGEKIWFNYFDLTTSNRQEAPVLMRINSGESVEIVSQRLNVPFSTENDLYDSGVDMSVVYRKYSDLDGQLMEELIPEENDTLALRTQFSAFISGNRVSYFFSEEDGNFRYIERLKYNNKYKFKSYKIDKRGHVLSQTDTIDLGYDVFNANLLKKGPDTLVYFYFNPIQKQAYVQYYSYDLNKMDEKPLEGFNINFGILMREVNENHVLVQYTEDTEMFFDSVVILAYDYSGKLLNKFKFLDEPNVSFAYKYLEQENEFLVFQSRYKDGAFLKRESRVFKTQNGSMIFKKSITGLDSLRVFSPYSFQFIGDDLIVSMAEGAFYVNDKAKFEQDIFAQAFSTMRVPLDQLGLVSSNKELVEEASVSLYPNPAHDYLYVSGQGIENYDRWEIYDLTGKRIQNGVCNRHDIELAIHIDSLQSGMYFLALISSNDSMLITTTKFTKID